VEELGGEVLGEAGAVGELRGGEGLGGRGGVLGQLGLGGDMIGGEKITVLESLKTIAKKKHKKRENRNRYTYEANRKKKRDSAASAAEKRDSEGFLPHHDRGQDVRVAVRVEPLAGIPLADQEGEELHEALQERGLLQARLFVF
jgi:hypothetical protein